MLDLIGIASLILMAVSGVVFLYTAHNFAFAVVDERSAATTQAAPVSFVVPASAAQASPVTTSAIYAGARVVVVASAAQARLYADVAQIKRQIAVV